MKPELVSAVNLVKSGLSYGEVSAQTGLSRSAIAGAVFRSRPKYEEYKAQRRKHPAGDTSYRYLRRKQSQERLAQYLRDHPQASRKQTIIALRAEGVTLQVLGDHFGVSREWIRRLANSYSARVTS